jgi:hypothetical protein
MSAFVKSHDLKFGYQFVRGRSERSAYSTSNYPSGLVARFRSGIADSVQVFNTPYDSVNYFKDNALYFQDKWKAAKKLTLNLGLRLQKSYGWIPEVCQEQTIFIAGRCFNEIQGFPHYLDLTPRFGAIYDLRGDGKTTLKFTANRYNLGIGGGYVDLLNPVTLQSDTRMWRDANLDQIPQLSELGAGTGFNLGTTNRYNPDVKRAYSNELAFEVAHQVLGDVVLTVGVYHRETKNNIGPRNVAVPRESYIPLTVTEVVSGRSITVYNQAPATRGKFDTLWDNSSELDSAFNGVDITFNKRMRNRWMVMGGLSLGKNVGDTYADTNGGTTDLNNPNFTFRHGRTPYDVPMSFKASATYELPYGIGLSGKVQHFTGFPEAPTVLVTSATAALTQVTQLVRADATGSSRLPSVNIADVRLSKVVRTPRNFEIEPALDIFNLMNANPIQSRVVQLGPTFGRATDILRGRLFRLGFYVRF